MSVSRSRLELIRWVLISLTFAVVVASWVWDIRDGWAVLWVGLFILMGFPAAMLSLHLHPPKFFKHLERRR